MRSVKFPLVLICLAFLSVALLRYLHLESIKLDPGSKTFETYRSGFEALIEKELSQNTAATKPVVTIREITETLTELSIKYDVTYTEHFKDGEKINRNSTGWALLKKENPTSDWKLFQIRDAQQSLRFSKGIRIGS